MANVRDFIPWRIRSLPFRVRALFRSWWRQDTSNDHECELVLPLLKGWAPILVDIGANDGWSQSNSYPLIQRGFRALCIEPHPAAFKKLQRRHRDNAKVTCLNCGCAAMEGEMPLYIGIDGNLAQLATFSREDNEWMRRMRTEKTISCPVRPLASILGEQDWPRRYGLLTIDTEGFDLEVLRGADLRTYRPHVIIVESSGPELEEPKRAFLAEAGYALKFTTASNTIWIEKEDFA